MKVKYLKDHQGRDTGDRPIARGTVVEVGSVIADWIGVIYELVPEPAPTPAPEPETKQTIITKRSRKRARSA